MIDQIRGIADAAWQSMLAYAIPPTPRNYEVWFAFCSAEKPLLNQRLDAILQSGQAITPGLLDQLYREFFAAHVDVRAIREGANELQQIATEVGDRVSADRALVDTFGKSLGRWSAN